MGAAALASAAPAQATLSANTIAPTATLAGRGHVARASVLIACTEGQLVRFSLTVAQDATTATGHGAGRCTGALTAYPVVVVARGSTLAEGHATACATAETYNRGGQLEDTRQWCRAGASAWPGNERRASRDPSQTGIPSDIHAAGEDFESSPRRLEPNIGSAGCTD